MATATLSLTVLGASPSTINPGGAASGYLVRGGGSAVLLDCGPGVVGRLRARLSIDQLDAVVISHFHADHFMDLVALRYGLKYGRWRTVGPLLVYLPPSGEHYLATLGQALDGDPRCFSDVLALREYAAAQPLEIGGLRLTPRAVQHYVPAFAITLEHQGRKLAYSGDAAPCPALVEAARDVDLFLCEATLASGAEDNPPPAPRGHMGADEAGIVARTAGARRLLLTHLPAEAAGQRLEAARRTFGRAVGLAREGRTYRV